MILLFRGCVFDLLGDEMFSFLLADLRASSFLGLCLELRNFKFFYFENDDEYVFLFFTDIAYFGYEQLNKILADLLKFLNKPELKSDYHKRLPALSLLPAGGFLRNGIIKAPIAA